MGYGDPGCYGGTLVPTPHIDSLAHQGLRFTQGYTISPVCGPSRVGLLSGLYPSRLGVYWNPDMGAVQMPKEHKVLPQALKTSGYTTGLVGKWNLNNPSWDPMPAANYFDYTYDVMVWEGDYWPDEKGNYKGVDDRNYGSNKISGVWGPTRAGDEYLTDRLSRHACEFIKQEKDNPFFLMLAYNAPHSPLQGKREHQEKLQHIKSEALKLYASMIMAIDAGIGAVLQQLDETGIRKNTIVVFVSDNGPALTQFKGMPKDWPRGEILGSTGGMRGQKGTYWEGGIRVPFIINWPTLGNRSDVIDTPVTTLDLYPTFCIMAGIDPSSYAELDGMSLIPLIQGKKSQLNSRSILWFSGSSGALRRGNWKLVFNPKEEPQLFNLSNDPYETENLSLQEPQIMKNLRSIVRAWRKNIPPAITPRKNL
ncbi:MAG: Arylsulfatase [Opitutia bacterium UBA7350]|nr:MAG: Arylsulfatase [Opitutae bacterium UBA7350]